MIDKQNPSKIKKRNSSSASSQSNSPDMDRLIKADVQSLDLLFIPNQKCSGTFNLTNLMHTMPVAVSLSTSDPSLLSFSNPFAVIPPLSPASLTVHLARPLHTPPISAPAPTIAVRSSMLPTGKAHSDHLRRLFSKPGPHIFKDATIPVSFVGPHVAEFLLLSPSAEDADIVDSLFTRAIAWCDRSQLTDLLRLAAAIGNPVLISALIDAGADVNPGGKSLIYAAVESGNADSVQILIESGCEIDDRLLLHVAVEMGRVDLMEAICLAFPNIDLNGVNSNGQTPLHVAAAHGGVDSVRFLTSIGADPDAVDIDGWTPLHHAAHVGNGEAVDCLLRKSVLGRHAVTKEGKSAFDIAGDGGYSALYDCLHLSDLLQRAATKNDVETIKMCIARGARVNGRDQNEWCALHRSAFKGHIESVETLVGYGARVDAVDDMGYTPLLRSVEAGHVEIAMYLLANGAKPSVKRDYMPMHYCLQDQFKNIDHVVVANYKKF